MNNKKKLAYVRSPFIVNLSGVLYSYVPVTYKFMRRLYNIYYFFRLDENILYSLQRCRSRDTS